MEMTQYQRDFVRMLDSMRDTCKGEITCAAGIEVKECKECLLANFCENDICFNAEKIIEIVTQWAKEHPFVTYEQKYEETFGVKPINDSGEYVCPSFLGLKSCKYLSGNGSPCAKCAKDFWQSEYKDPKKEGE